MIVTVIVIIAAGYVQGQQDGDLSGDPGYSSAPGDGDCASCHNDIDPNDGGELTLALSVSEYVPGEDVDIDTFDELHYSAGQRG